jgi:hypothetical protein
MPYFLEITHYVLAYLPASTREGVPWGGLRNVNTGNVGTVMAKAKQANSDAAALKNQLVGMYQTQRSEEEKLTQVNGKVY